MRPIKLKRIKILSTIIFVWSCFTGNAQGGWDIEYLPVGDIDSSFVEKEIGFDFKRSNQDTFIELRSRLEIRDLLIQTDTVELVISNQTYHFVESWEIYDDQGFLNDQSLRSTNSRGITISKMILKKVSLTEFIVVAEVNVDGLNKSVEIKVNKSLIKGVLTKIELIDDNSQESPSRKRKRKSCRKGK